MVRSISDSPVAVIDAADDAADRMPVRADALARIVRAGCAPGSNVVVIAGPAGAGKTWVARSALTAFARHKMLVGAGKYGEGEGQSALAPIMAALSEIVTDGLARLYDPQTGVASLTDALGVDLEVLISAGLAAPGLPARSGIKALADRRQGMNRIIAATLHLLRWTERFGVARALLIDDWWRAPAEAAALLRAIAAGGGGQPLTLLLTQRDATEDDVVADGRASLVERLDPLDDAEIAALLSNRIGVPEQAALIMATLGDAVPRLPFDIVQVADGFARSGAFRRDARRRWRLDAARAGGLAFDAETRIARLSTVARGLATALALWGDAAPRDALLAATGAPVDCAETRSALRELQAQGVIGGAGAGRGRIAFHHDKLRRASLDRVSPETLAAASAAMAERLPADGAPDEIERAALHLRLSGGLAEAAPDRWRDRFARGAAAARGRGDGDIAASFAEAALSLRERAPAGNRETDRLILREAVLAAADRDDPVTEQRARWLVAASSSPGESCEDYETGAVALRLARQPEAAWRLACEGLGSIGIRPPRGELTGAFLFAAAAWWLGRRGDHRGAPPDAGAAPLDAFTGIAAAAAAIAYHRDPRAAGVIGFRASLIAGRMARRSAYWQSVDAFLFAVLGARARAADAGERALEGFAEQRVLRAATLYQAIFFGVHWRRPLGSQRDRFREVTRIALIEGDLITASYGLRIFIMSGWRSGTSLDALLKEAIEARGRLRMLGEASFVDEMDAMVALLEGLTGETPWNPAAWRDDIPTRNHVIDLELSNLAGDWPETVRRAAILRPLRRDYNVQADSVVMRFHETLARLRCGLRARRRDVAFLRRAAALNPAEHAAKLALIDAERLRQRGAPIGDTLIAYAAAVDAADRADSRLDAALTARCAAAFAAEAGDAALARSYCDHADAILAAWGMRAKVAAAPPPPDTEVLADAEARAIAAERADAAKSRLMIHVGHELRTPLQALQTMLDLDRDGAAPVDLGEVRAVLASFKAIVDDLDIGGGFAEERSAGTVRQVDVAELIRSEMRVWQHGAAMTLCADGPLAPVDVAADRLRQIIRNLLSNAVKYGAVTRDGVPIEITLAMSPAGEDRTAVSIAVRDHGPGIPAARIGRLFEPFERGVFTGDGRGSGIGLALSRRIADRLGGSLEARNHPAGGACFTLTFEAARSTRADTPVAATPATILLVEDSALIRQLLAAMLTRAGHRVIEAGDAAQARAAWRDHAVDLAVLDMGLPDASGLDVLAAIRASAPLPAILLTASGTGEAEAAARDDPLLRVLRKPASAAEVIATIGALLGAPAPCAVGWDVAQPGIDELYREARIAVVEQASACLETMPGAPAVHQLAGLAAQFGWTAVAEAVEALGDAAAGGASLDGPRRALRTAIARMR